MCGSGSNLDSTAAASAAAKASAVAESAVAAVAAAAETEVASGKKQSLRDHEIEGRAKTVPQGKADLPMHRHASLALLGQFNGRAPV